MPNRDHLQREEIRGVGARQGYARKMMESWVAEPKPARKGERDKHERGDTCQNQENKASEICQMDSYPQWVSQRVSQRVEW